MTLEELNTHLAILQEYETAQDLLQSLETTVLTASRLDAMPHAPGIGDRTAALAVKITEQHEVVARYERMVKMSSVSVKAFIDSVTDIRLNSLLYLRFICGYDWQSVAAIVGSSVDAVKSLVYRFFRSQPK